MHQAAGTATFVVRAWVAFEIARLGFRFILGGRLGPAFEAAVERTDGAPPVAPR